MIQFTEFKMHGYPAVRFWRSLLTAGCVFKLKGRTGRFVVWNMRWDGYGFGQVFLRRVV